MPKNLNLTAQDVYSEEFHVDLKGYAPAEVDEFLDQVIEDYQEYDEKIEELSQAITRYEQKINELQAKIVELNTDNRKLRDQMKSGMVAANNSDQVDILKRISRLEQAVFHNNRYNGGYRGSKNKRKNNNAAQHQAQAHEHEKVEPQMVAPQTVEPEQPKVAQPKEVQQEEN